jgi:prolyl oligopeptidase PreP (S9A serine peptidase family)
MAGRGGPRPNSGRKPLREKYNSAITKAEKVFAGHQEKAALNIVQLADGGVARVEVIEKAAGTIMEDVFETGEDGRIRKMRRRVFPDLDPEQMIEVERRTVTLPPDLDANEYIIDRLHGKPATVVEDNSNDILADLMLPEQQ